MINNEIHRLTNIRASLENIIDDLYEQDADYVVNNNVLSIIDDCNKLNSIKDNWKDKWNFNNWATTYDTSVREDRGALKIYKNYDLILDSVYEEVHKLNLKAPKILEIGVETGNLASKFLASGYDLIGIDQSRDMLNVCKSKYPNLIVRLGEFLKIPYSDNSFDVIVSTYAFHHLNDDEKSVAIKEMIRVLKGNGYIVIGDLMFENKFMETNILQTLSQDQILEIKDEYYSYIDVLQYEFEKFNKKLSYSQIDTFNFVVCIN
ncbi:MAG: class I SAM-dependent methyltransferase [Paraclostridium sp.]